MTNQFTDEQVEAAAIGYNTFPWNYPELSSLEKQHARIRSALEAAAGIAPQAPSGPIMTRFHASYPGMAELWHTYCAEHPKWGTCGEEEQARRDIAEHLETEHATTVQPSSTVDEDALAEVIRRSYENEQGLKIRDDKRTARAVAEWLKGQGR